ncbi:hypothetical protein D8Y23_06610 [Microbacterium enclense]|uniref:Transcriptional regulator, AbiEi antitoxin, Type IV TA system n=1 Tax=Microbacterium enclense TaxID=993073 RepID=A0A3S3KZD3_9MICO|nr:hypothetical protein D8Y23_06610 [Microbacterium enclense]
MHRGMYVARESLTDLRPASVHRLEALAVIARMRGGDAVLSHLTAAVVHGLPQYRFGRTPVELTVPEGSRAPSRGRVRRHQDEPNDSDVVEIDGIRCTSLERTVFDVARTRSMEVALSCADAALRREAGRRHGVDSASQDAWRERMRERVARAAGHRGVAGARWLIEFADGRAELPGESVSRLQLFRLGFRDLDLQVPIAGPAGREYFVDIALRECRTFWEFDGEAKYRDPALRADATIEQILLDEKRREDWIRGTTQWRLCRGGFRDIADPGTLAARLAAFGVTPQT